MGRRSTVAYDQAGNAMAGTDPLGRVTSYGYDLAGRMTAVTDPLGRVTTTSFDRAGRETLRADALGGLWTGASWMDRFRAILIRWNKKARNYNAMLHFALAIIAYRAAGLFG